MSESRLSFRANALHLSLLASLGLLASACGGSVQTTSEASGGDGSVGSRAGSPGSDATSAGPAGSGGGTAVSASGPFDCAAPKYDPSTGFTACLGGVAHRTAAVSCQLIPNPYDAGPPGYVSPNGGSAKLGDPCSYQVDCAGIPLGYCPFGEMGTQFCQAGCVQDSDCGIEAACICDGSSHGGACTERSECSTDSSCAPGSFCTVAVNADNDCLYVPARLHCEDGSDACQTDADCGEGHSCAIRDLRRVCIPGVVCGRPFLVEDAPRMAAVVSAGGWQGRFRAAPNVAQLSESERALLAAHWARLGQMEHASIAAFARFNLQLLSLGAPSSLVEACNRAIVDETAHAKVCFGLASHYAELPLGPGPLDLSHCLEITSLLEIAKLVVLEGCIGETAAALEASESAALATDPVVRAALSQIAEDEQRHAALAFRFLRWALEHATLPQRREIELAARAGLASAESRAHNGEGGHGLAGHGLLSDALLGRVRGHAVQRAVRPLLAALFAQVEGSSSGSEGAPQHDAEGWADAHAQA